MAFFAAVLALVGVTTAHEAGHYLAVRVKRLQVLRVRIGQGPLVWRGRHRGAELLLRLVPIGGRIQYESVPPGFGEAVVAVSGAAANLALALLAFAVAGLLTAPVSPMAPGDANVIAYAASHAGAWFWAVPGALIELVATGSAVELSRGVRVLGELVMARPLPSLPYVVGALSALWAALNLLPVPFIETDGWHVARSLWRGIARGWTR